MPKNKWHWPKTNVKCLECGFYFREENEGEEKRCPKCGADDNHLERAKLNTKALATGDFRDDLID